MSGGVRWTIGIPSVPARRTLRDRVLQRLDRQLAKYNDIELLVLEDNRMRELGPKRQAIVDIAQGEYVNFIDDDDLISDHYIDTLYPLLDGVDCVGFTGNISIEGSAWKNVFYSKENGFDNKPDGYYRPIQHLTPVRTELARQVPYRGHRHEDSNWAKDMIKKGLLKTENKTDEMIYCYYSTRVKNRIGVWKDK